MTGRAWILRSFAGAVMALAAVTAGAAGEPSAAEASDDPAALVRLLGQPGHVALMRHALAPGTGDPPGFDPNDCATQRNLSEDGRRQAREAGERLRSLGLAQARVLSSARCRAAETGALLGYGAVEHAPVLDSGFGSRSTQDERRAGTIALMRSLAGKGGAILLSHQVNITAVTGIYPTSGELVVLRVPKDGDPVVAGRLVPAAAE
ncbi:histidine phosphatase family protein [Arenibaculum pallidiluteum]|uniref:histidine phosphatase family protein n=1 Tax=Arenibaculum pallidiluteum TaxID=2812559 RepID=UPI001F28501F|nr:histidine phosphatase family protein [Arenibaculum pallidiluteum]